MALLNEGGQRTLQVASENYTETTSIDKRSFQYLCDEYPILQQLLRNHMFYKYDDSIQMFLRNSLKQVDFLKKAHWKTLA